MGELSARSAYLRSEKLNNIATEMLYDRKSELDEVEHWKEVALKEHERSQELLHISSTVSDASTEIVLRERARNRELADMVGQLLGRNEQLTAEVKRLNAEKESLFSDLHLTLQATAARDMREADAAATMAREDAEATERTLTELQEVEGAPLPGPTHPTALAALWPVTLTP